MKNLWYAISILAVTLQPSANAAAPVYKILYNFPGKSHGGQPVAGVVVDAEGNLYGTTASGGTTNKVCGPDGCGVVYKLDKTGKETVLYSFTGGADGNRPLGLVRDTADNLYGITQDGGDPNCICGVVFRLSTTTHKLTVLHTFTGGADGGYPSGYGGGLLLLRDSEGNLYGTTSGGGDTNNCQGVGCGVVFKIDTTNTETVLYTFTGGADGGNPFAGLIQDQAGSLYGTTYDGGTDDGGVVFTLDSAGMETVLYSFTACDPYGLGGGPEANLIRDTAGNLYGTTYCGGNMDYGDVFKLDSNGNLTVLHYFSETDGAYPTGRIIRDSDGTIYGTTMFGGRYGSGTRQGGVVFQIPRKGTSVLHNFGGYEKGDGSEPYGGLTRDGEGNFYGTTFTGGKHEGGIVFKITP
jgi:uncharacterized repeat protein (TIGR03803 family)